GHQPDRSRASRLSESNSSGELPRAGARVAGPPNVLLPGTGGAPPLPIAPGESPKEAPWGAEPVDGGASPVSEMATRCSWSSALYHAKNSALAALSVGSFPWDMAY